MSKKKAVELTKERPWRVLRHAGGSPTVVGYARVSTREQHLEAQLAALREAGCGRVYAEKISGAASSRPGWAACVEALRPGDTLAVLRVDRMGRRLTELVRSLDEIRALGAHIRSLEEGLDTSARGGAFAFTIVAAFAEKVRADISENTKAGLAELKKRGAPVGRPSKLQPAKIAQLLHLRGQGFTLREIASATNLGHGTVAKGLELAQGKQADPRQLQLGGVP